MIAPLRRLYLSLPPTARGAFFMLIVVGFFFWLFRSRD